MEGDPNDANRSAKRAKVESSEDSPTDGVLAANAGAATASPSTTTTTTTLPNVDSSYTYRPRPRAPPDPKRYVNLWKEELSSRGPDKSRNTSTTPPSLSTILDELDLAMHHQKTWERINALQQTIDECEREIDELRKELDIRTCLPRLLGKDRDDKCLFWAEILPSHLQYDREVAWTLVRAAKEPSMRPARGNICSDYYSSTGDEDSDEYRDLSTLPSSFQWTLGWEFHCPLREDRQLLLASLDKGFDCDIRILWTDQIANDREILVKIFEKCPWCLDKADVPILFRSDPALIRAFARSTSLRWYREKLVWSEADNFVCRLIVDLSEDPELLAELIRQCVDTKNKDKWACEMAKEHLRIIKRSSKHYLLLVNAVAKEMSCVPWEEYRDHCPLRYRDLPLGLLRSREFILAFISFDVSVTSEVPEDLRDDVELWQRAVQRAPRYGNIQIPAPSPDFPSKLFYLLLLEDAMVVSIESPGIVLGLLDAMKDRDVARKYASVPAHKLEKLLEGLVQDAFESDRDFWIEHAEMHRCPLSHWNWVPKHYQVDPAVILAWARHAKEMDSRWLLSKDPEVLDSLLSDRQVLLNCLPPIWTDARSRYRHEDHQQIWTRIDPTVLDISLWVELLLRGEQDCLAERIPVEIQDEPAIVTARLRSTMKDAEWFTDLFCRTLFLDVQLQNLEFLLEVIQGMDAKEFFESRLYLNVEMRILDEPEVALALLSKGWCARHRRFEEAVEMASWSADPEFLMIVAERQLMSAFRGCCPEILCTDKVLALKVLQVDAGLWNLLDHRVYDQDEEEDGDGEGRPVCPLKYDFDVLMSVLESTPAAILTLIPPLDSQTRRNYLECKFPTKQIVDFAREVRQRLTLHASIETVMMGTRTRDGMRHVSSTCSPLSLLDQDRYTTGDFRKRLTALLGAPSVDDGTVASLRRVSNSLTRYGF